MERFLVKNFGCRASQADGAAIEAGLAAKGLASVGDVQDADLVVLNTCTVTATADDEVRRGNGADADGGRGGSRLGAAEIFDALRIAGHGPSTNPT